MLVQYSSQKLQSVFIGIDSSLRQKSRYFQSWDHMQCQDLTVMIYGVFPPRTRSDFRLCRYAASWTTSLQHYNESLIELEANDISSKQFDRIARPHRSTGVSWKMNQCYQRTLYDQACRLLAFHDFLVLVFFILCKCDILEYTCRYQKSFLLFLTSFSTLLSVRYFPNVP